MATYSFSVTEGVAAQEKVPVDTTGATSATIYFTKRSSGPWNVLSGASVTVSPGYVTVSISGAAVTTNSFPAYYYIDLDNNPSAVTGRVFIDTPTTTSPSGPHTHPESDVTGLDASLSGKVDTTDARLADARTPTAHGHPQTDVTNLDTVLATKVDTGDSRLTDSRTPTTHTHVSTGVSFTSTGLTVVTGSSVDAALRNIDTWANSRPTHTSGLLVNRPANGAVPDGSTYLATDQNGGTPYQMVAGGWSQMGAGVTQPSGQIIAGPVQMAPAAQFDVKAVGTTETDVPGMSINVPASSRPVLLRASFELQSNSGTAAVASQMRISVKITDSANVNQKSAAINFVQVTAAAVVFANQVSLEAYLPAPVAAATYKIRAVLLAAAPANWTSALILPNNGLAGNDNFYAVTV